MSKGFSPECAQDLPPELSRWLHLFYAYLQIEQAYADALEWLGRTGVPYQNQQLVRDDALACQP